MTETTVPPAFLRDLDGVRDPLVSQLLSMLVSLGGEVFVLKAELQRLRLALAAAGGVGEDALEAVRRSPDFVAWLSREEREFTRALMDPIARAREIARPGAAAAR
jgi:hypothetical protein